MRGVRIDDEENPLKKKLTWKNFVTMPIMPPYELDGSFFFDTLLRSRKATTKANRTKTTMIR